ncbi:MAG TPA: AGE family epimerase/isomerase [Candidatus Sulfopaludibacter sp.]|nr:AGE family epimerase/isomerase [Candidatus Sulfopaludibacter sp.]
MNGLFLRRRPCVWQLIATLFFIAAPGQGMDFSTPAREMKAQLAQKILPYWYDTAQDTHRGGYLLADDVVKGRRAPAEKQIVTQSRMVWTFSLAHIEGYSDTNRNYLAAATQGYHFLLNHFLDRQQGGYFWTTDLDGRPMNDCKLLYGQAFTIYAFVEYYRASGNPEALAHALDLYHTIQARLYDIKNGGWFEHADRTWQPLAAGDPRNQVEVIGYKSANSHLHWMEALTELYDATRDPGVKKSLAEAVRINATCFYPDDPAQCAFYCQFDWKPVTAAGKAGLSYGHNVEFAWLMIRAEQVLGQKPSWNHFYALLNHALKNGYDHQRGGLYYRGFDDQPATDTEKIWWVQAEMLSVLTTALQHQDDPRDEVALSRELQFIKTYQANPATGIWQYAVAADGQPVDPTLANSWKANYHDVRAMMKFVDAFAGN